MSIDSREFVQVPPDGAGKALTATPLISIEYSSGSAGAFNVGDKVVGATSGAEATVSSVHEETASTGSITATSQHEYVPVDWQVGENINIAGSPVAVVVSSIDYHVPQHVLVGQNNPRYGQSVDVEGSAFVRFANGSPSFDAEGRLEVSQENWVGIYSQTYDEDPELIDTQLAVNGAINYDVPSSTTELQVDDTNGSSVERQTHLYHQYRSGVAVSAMMTVAAGADTASCRRCWGYFDDNDGLFFEYDGTTLNVVVRSSTSGSVVETRVPQSQWNGDRVDGTGNLVTNPSQGLLDPEKFYLYDISFLYLGAGPAVFSVVIEGKRVVLHTFANGGSDSVPYMRTGSLPLRWEIANLAATTGPTQMRQGNSTVLHYGEWAPQKRLRGSEARTPEAVTGPTALAVIRAVQTINGKDNRGIVLPTELRAVSSAETIHLKITRGGSFTVDTWFQDEPSAILEQGSEAGGPPTIVSAGETLYSQLIVPGEVGYVDLTQIFSVRADGEIKRQADITQAEVYAVIVQSIDGVTATDVTVSFNWSEVY